MQDMFTLIDVFGNKWHLRSIEAIREPAGAEADAEGNTIALVYWNVRAEPIKVAKDASTIEADYNAFWDNRFASTNSATQGSTPAVPSTQSIATTGDTPVTVDAPAKNETVFPVGQGEGPTLPEEDADTTAPKSSSKKANANTVSKAKGRRLQKLVVELLLKKYAKLTSDDVRSTSMGAGGVDVLLSAAAKRLFPYSIECKNQEKLKAFMICGSRLPPTPVRIHILCW